MKKLLLCGLFILMFASFVQADLTEVGSLLEDVSRNRVYITDETNNDLLVLDTQTNTITNTVDDIGSRPTSMAMTRDNAFLYIALTGGSEIAIIDLNTLTKTGSIVVARTPTHVAVNSEHLFVSYSDRFPQTGPDIINLETKLVVGSLGNNRREDALIETHGEEVYMGTPRYPRTMTRYSMNGAEESLVATSEDRLFNHISDYQLTSDGSKVVVAGGSRFLHVLDASDFRKLGELPLEESASSMVIDNEDQYVYSAYRSWDSPKEVRIAKLDMNSYTSVEIYELHIGDLRVQARSLALVNNTLYFAAADYWDSDETNIFSFNLDTLEVTGILQSVEHELVFENVEIWQSVFGSDHTSRVNVEFDISNIGNMDATGLMIKVFIPELGITEEKSMWSITPDQSRNADFSIEDNAQVAGTYTVNIEVESDAGTYSTNGEVELAIFDNVPEPTEADIMVLELLVDEPVSYEEETVIALTLMNLDPVDIEPEQYEHYVIIDGEELMVEGIELQIPGESVLVLFTLLQFEESDVGEHTITSGIRLIDPLVDPDTSDNEASVIVNVVAPSDPLPPIVPAPAPTPEPQPVPEPVDEVEIQERVDEAVEKAVKNLDEDHYEELRDLRQELEQDHDKELNTLKQEVVELKTVQKEQQVEVVQETIPVKQPVTQQAVRKKSTWVPVLIGAAVGLILIITLLAVMLTKTE